MRVNLINKKKIDEEPTVERERDEPLCRLLRETKREKTMGDEAKMGKEMKREESMGDEKREIASSRHT